MNQPIISERFDLDDIRKLREYNAVRYEHMTSQEIAEDTKAGAAELLKMLDWKKFIKV